MWIDNGASIFVDISTACNAGCPQCHRTEMFETRTADWLPVSTWSLEDVQKVYRKELMIGDNPFIRRVEICGTWGDPLMCKDFREIIEYFLENTEVKVQVMTNGSLREELWWWELGILSRRHNRRLTVTFDIDGINQDMHSKYRQKTSLKKILSNMSAFVEGGGRATTFTVLFKHNENYLDQIKSLCKENGSEHHTWTTSERWYVAPDKWEFKNSEGKDDLLEKAEVIRHGGNNL